MKTLIQKYFLVVPVAFVVFLTSVTQALAEDIEIYNRTQTIPNVLFVIDRSGSMGDPIDPANPGGLSRFEVVQSALNTILMQSYETLNIGYMDFSGDQASGVDFPVADVNMISKSIEPGVVSTTETYSELISRVVTNSPNPGGATPIVEALYEAALYYRGDDVLLGKYEPGTWNDTNSQYENGDSRAAGPQTFTGATWDSNIGDFVGTPQYVSPIQTACTENFIILLSDGAPTVSSSTVKTNIRELYNPDKSSCDTMSAYTDSDIISHGECGTDITSFLNSVDQSSQTGDQFIETHTIGFQLDASPETKTFLENIATAGGGEFHDANSSDPMQLVTILQNIVKAAEQPTPLTIGRVGNTLNVSTLSSSRDEVYVPLFTPLPNEPRWPGNLKGYTFDSLGFLKGLDNNQAFIDGDFNPASRSYWSASADGASIGQGGVAVNINPSVRNTKTDTGSGTSRSFQSLDSANTTLTSNPVLFGLASGTTAATIQELIEWARGVDVDDENSNGNITESRQFIGDALHTSPVVANYNGSVTDPVLNNSIERVAFFMTNEGYLHAINVTGNTPSDGGTELFSYMPSDILSNLDLLRRNVSGTPKVYGLDGPLTLFQVGGFANVAGDKYLYLGMRRGGMNYYALNVTDPLNPVLMWVIEGGSGDFKELAQTWSEPIVTNVTHNGTTKLALVFGAGYDTNQDTVLTHTADSKGRAVYIVDAVTGAKLWSAGPASSPDIHNLTLGLTNGIAGDVSVIDFDNDTIADRLYFGDTGGQIWRIDFQGDLNGTAGFSADFSGYKLADLHGTSVNDNRRFFARPVAALTGNGKLAVSIGSGNRSHPLDAAVQDRFYTIYDPNINAVPTSAPSVITDGNLQDITGFSTGYTDTNKIGWRFDLATGEKVFNAASILRGEVFFNTYYRPVTLCSDDPDRSRLFALDLEGNSTRDLDGDLSNGDDIFISTYNFGIVSEFALHYGTTGKVRSIFLPNIENVYSSNTLYDKFWTNNP